MSTPLKLAAGLAAVVLVAVVGWHSCPGAIERRRLSGSADADVERHTTSPGSTRRTPAHIVATDRDGAGIASAGSFATAASSRSFTVHACRRAGAAVISRRLRAARRIVRQRGRVRAL